MSVLALCPSRGRPRQAMDTLVSFNATRRDVRTRLVFIVDSDDPTRADYPPSHTRIVEPGGNMGAALAAAVVDADIMRDATVIGMIGDDNRFRTRGWDRIFGEWLAEHPGIAYGDDGLQHERLPTSWWVSRPFVDAFGMAPAWLNHLYMDNFWKAIGEGAGCLRYFGEVSIEHLHPLAGKAVDDATYVRSSAHIAHDKRAFHDWEKSGKAKDVARARSLVSKGDKRRVLADWHHPALWESLSMLFEDRFGWELYSMGGPEWKQQGWKFDTEDVIGWKADDYLSLDGAALVDDHYEVCPREYPRPRKIVTVEQSNAMRWDFVLGSVPAHESTFAQLAGRYAARFIHQVGNARHPINRSVSQVVLASAQVNTRLLRNVKIIPYHQEFDRSVFGYAEPTDPLAVSSFMLRLDWTSCDYRWMADAKGIGWRTFGGADNRDPGYLAPMSKVADAMAASGWIWHDKRVGDGYGHIIHNAMAMGRPLIGHASHFAGQTSEPFWRDLDTCIDLDRHAPADVCRLIRAIATDADWYRDLSERARAAFDKHVDFDGEADRIRAELDR